MLQCKIRTFINSKLTETCYIVPHHFVIFPGDCTDGRVKNSIALVCVRLSVSVMWCRHSRCHGEGNWTLNGRRWALRTCVVDSQVLCKLTQELKQTEPTKNPSQLPPPPPPKSAHYSPDVSTAYACTVQCHRTTSPSPHPQPPTLHITHHTSQDTVCHSSYLSDTQHPPGLASRAQSASHFANHTQ